MYFFYLDRLYTKFMTDPTSPQVNVAQAGGSYLSRIFMNKKILIILSLTAVFIGLALYVYTAYIAPRLQPSYVPNREFVPIDADAETKHATLYYFFVEWCPFCKKATPVWEALKTKYEGKAINGVTIGFKSFNADTQEADVAAFEEQYKVKIDGFPTIYLVKGNQVVEYDAKPDEKALTEFLNTAL